MKNAILNIKPDGQSGDKDFVSQLQQLEELHIRGSITEEEFTKAKEKLLNNN